jgi:hypothetical protein
MKKIFLTFFESHHHSTSQKHYYSKPKLHPPHQEISRNLINKSHQQISSTNLINKSHQEISSANLINKSHQQISSNLITMKFSTATIFTILFTTVYGLVNTEEKLEFIPNPHRVREEPPAQVGQDDATESPKGKPA